jgi:hypothetical protein
MNETIILRGEPQKLRLSSILKNWKQMLAQGKPLAVTIGIAKQKRTIDQNRMLHALVNQLAAEVWIDGKQFGPEAWKEHVRQKFIGTEEIDLPDGRRIERGISTTTLDVADFSELLEQLQAWMMTEFALIPGVQLE